MRAKYLHYFSNTSSESILEAYGIVTKDKEPTNILKPTECPQCKEPNQPSSRFCAKCRMILTYDMHAETLELEQKKDSRLQTLEERVTEMDQMFRDWEYIQIAGTPDKPK
ncbi:MAG: zinc ribbon domain-containing protein [Thermoproteota archaeon]|nr:zinc ribbon domain-containing protein [Thermoproteota archaeon]